MAYIITRKVIYKRSRYDNVYIDTAFLDLRWLLRASSCDTTRPNITGILVEPTKIVATDGFRLHIITNPYPSIPSGEYDVYGINQSKVILIAKDTNSAFEFPKWNRPSVTMEGIKPEHEIAVSDSTYFYIEILKYRICKIKLLQDAISNEPMNIKIYGDRQPVIITTQTHTAIIMPLSDGKVS